MSFWLARHGPILVYALAYLLVLGWLRRRFGARWSRRTIAIGVFVCALFVVALVVARRLALRTGTDAEMLAWGWLQLWSMAVLEIAALLWSIEILLFAVRRARRTSENTSEKQAPNEDRRKTMATIGGVAVGVVSGGPILWGTLKTRLDVEVTEVPIRLARLPKVLDGMTLVQLTDVHVGAWMGERELAHAEDIVRGLRPDLVLFTGDLVNLQRRWIAPAARWLARVGALGRFGSKAIVGNHEHYAGVYACMDAMRRAGSDVLFNESRIVAPNDGGGFGIVGVDDVHGPENSGTPGPRVASPLSTLTPDAARILLCHQPSYLDRAAAYDFDLMLSGHTHGGQIAPLGKMFVAGLYGIASGFAQMGATTLYVSRGFGTSGPPTRIGIRPEITKIVLVAA